jgi:hypothetical protein
LGEGDFFWIEPDGSSLRSFEARIPTDRLPQPSWQPLANLIEWELPPAGWPADCSAIQRIPLRLAPTERWLEPSLLLTSLAIWADYAVTASQVRLDRWRFAATSRGSALIQGDPLPPIPGRQFVVREGIAVPAGLSWQPAVDAAVVRQSLQLGPTDVALWSADDRCEIIHAEQFVAATRAAVRLTFQQPA